MTDSGEKLRAFALAVVMVVSVFVTPIALAGSATAASNVDGSVSLTVSTAGNQATVTVDDDDLNTDTNTAENHVVNVESTSESPRGFEQTSSDTSDGSTQTVTITDNVSDRNNDNTIDKSDFSLVGAPDESITNVVQNGNDYDVTISDSGSTTSDSSTESVSYDKLDSLETASDTEQGTSTPITTTNSVGDRNGDGELTKADIDLVNSSDDESITNVARNSDGTVDVTITDSNDDGDTGVEKIEYLATETVKLTETGTDTGTFEGTIGVKNSNSALTTADELYVQHQDDITATYWDSSASAVRTATQTWKQVAASASASPSQPSTGESVSLDASGSSGSISSYDWDTDGDGNYDDASGSNPSVSFSSQGVKQVGLKVDDGSGNTDTTTVNVLVGESGPPTAKIQVFPRTVTKGEIAYLVAQKSSDDIPNGIQKYEWDVGADGTYEYSSTTGAFATHTFSSTGDKTVKLRVTDYAGNTDTVTKTVTVQGKASVSNTNVEHTGNGTAPSGTISVATRNEGGMLKIHLYRGSSSSNRDLGAAGVDESTELWVNVTIDSYEPNAMMASAKVDNWTTSPNSEGSGTNISIKLHPINMQRLSNPGSKSPGRWPSQNKQADLSIKPGAHLATFDMPDGTTFESDFDGATLMSDAQQFSPPRYDSTTNKLTYTVAAPHWKASGNKVSSNTNIGFYEARIPPGLVDRMGIDNPDELAGTYTSGGSSSSLSNIAVTETDSGGLYVNVTGIHYSSGTVELAKDTTNPTADAGSDQTVELGNSVSFDGSSSSDNRKIDTYEWDVDDDGSYEKTGETPSNTYSSTGDKTVTLRVTDGNGNTDTDTVTVTVEDTTNPTADAGSDATVDEGEQVTLDGSASSDNDNIDSYEWDVDDDGSYEKSGASVTHTYSSAGDRTVTLRVTDPAGNTNTDTVTVTVESTGGGDGGDSGGSSGETSASDENEGTTGPVEVTRTDGRTDIHVREPSDDMSVDLSSDEATGSVAATKLSLDAATSDEFTMNVSTHESAPADTPTPAASDVGGEPAGYVQVDHSVPDSSLSDARLRFTVSYDALPEDVGGDNVVLYRYHDGEWVAQETSVVEFASDGYVLDAELDGMSVFAVGTDGEPALATTDVTVEETSVTAGDPVTVQATVTNDGGLEGSTTVTLTVDGAARDEATVTVAPGASTTVDLTATFDEPGEYDITVGETDAVSVAVESAATATPTPTATATATPTPTATTTPAPAATPAPTATATASPTDVHTQTPTASPTASPTPTASSSGLGPGPGPAVALLAVVFAALTLARLRRS